MAKKGSQLTVRTATEIQGGEFVILGYAGRSYQMTLDELKKFIGIIEADGGSVDLTQVTTDILPLADASKDIGSLEKRWKKVYSTALAVKAQSVDEEEVNIHDGGIEGKIGQDIQWSIDGSGKANFYELTVNGADVATMQYVNNELSKILGGASGAYDTLKEIEDILKNDTTGLAALLEEIGTKADKSTVVAINSRVSDLEDADFVDIDSLRSALGDYYTKEQVDDLLGEAGGVDLTGYVNEIAASETGNGIASVSKDGSKLTFTKATFLTDATVPAARALFYGGIKIGYKDNGKNYGVLLDDSGKAYVNVPWESYDLSKFLERAGGSVNYLQVSPANASDGETINIGVTANEISGIHGNGVVDWKINSNGAWIGTNQLATQSWANSNFHPLTTVDTTPTLSSSNLVTSGGVAKAVAELAESAERLYQQKITSTNKLAYSLISGTPTLATVATSGSYNDLTNKPTIPSAVTESTVSGWGFTKNAGTITGIKMNGASKGTSGVVDLGTVITAHQTIHSLSFAAGTPSIGSGLTYSPTSEEKTINIPTKTSHLTNDSNFLTSSSTLASAKLDKNTINIAGTSVSLGESITQNQLIANLGLKGLAFKDSVEITSSNVTTALGYTPYNSANFTKANIKSTLGISDWALASSKPTYTAAEVGALPSTTTIPNSTIVANWGFITEPTLNNRLAGYLPLSGGVMKTSSGIYNESDQNGYGAIGFNFDHNAFGSLTFPTRLRSSSADVLLHVGLAKTQYTLIHSGNIGDYTLAKDSNGTVLLNGTLYVDGAGASIEIKEGAIKSNLSGTDSWSIDDSGKCSLNGSLVIGTDTNTSYKHVRIKRNGTTAELSHSGGATNLMYGSRSLTLSEAQFVISGNENNDIKTIFRDNGSITNIDVSLAAIRHALCFAWYGTEWRIGNIRGGSSDTLGFGVTTHDDYCVFRVNTKGGWINEQSIIHSGNIGNQTVYRADRAEKLIYSDSTVGLQVLSGGKVLASNQITLDGNANYGIYRGSYYTSALTTEDIVIDAKKLILGYYGNVGIGTTNPQYKLDVAGGVRIDGDINFGEGTGNRQLVILKDGGFRFYGAAGGWAFGMAAYGYDKSTNLGNSAGSFGTTNQLHYHFYGGTYDKPHMVILPNANVGIGTTNPQAKLHVVGGVKITQGLTVGSATDYIAYDGSSLTGYKSSASAWSIDPSGNGSFASLTVGGNAVLTQGALTSINSTLNNKANTTDVIPWTKVADFTTVVSPQSVTGTATGRWYQVVRASANNNMLLVNVPWVNNTYDLSSYLPKAGGTISGSLTFSATSGNHIIGNANNVLQLKPGTGSDPVLPIKIAKLSSGRHTIYCDEDQAYDLGTSSYSYYYVYSRYSSASSDATKKNIIGNIPLTTAQIANAPAVSFTWKDSGEKSHGTIAQYWKEILPEFVSGDEGSYGLNYAALGVVSSIILARNIETHEQRIARLEKEISDLQKELNTLVNNE